MENLIDENEVYGEVRGFDWEFVFMCIAIAVIVLSVVVIVYGQYFILPIVGQ